jgi:hypothetical protein
LPLLIIIAIIAIDITLMLAIIAMIAAIISLTLRHY